MHHATWSTFSWSRFKTFAEFNFWFSPPLSSCCQSFLIGIVVPDPEVFVDWAKERGFVGSYEELCQNPVREMNPNFMTLHYWMLSRTIDWVTGLPTGCKEGCFRGHESWREGSRTEVLWTGEGSLLTSVLVKICQLQTPSTDFLLWFCVSPFGWRTFTCIRRRSASPTAFSPPRWKVDAPTSAESFRNKYQACTARRPFKGLHSVIRAQHPTVTGVQ